MPSILPNTDRGLLTADNCALAFIDHQPQMAFGVGSGIDRQLLVNNVLLLAKGAKLFNVPTILTTVETESFSGSMWPQLLDLFPQQKPIERTGMNSWDTPAFREAIKATGKKPIALPRWPPARAKRKTVNALTRTQLATKLRSTRGCTSVVVSMVVPFAWGTNRARSTYR